MLEKRKRVGNLKEYLGILKYDKEWDEIEKVLKIGWKNWNKKDAKIE